MSEKNLGQKVLLIAGVLVLALLALVRYDRSTGRLALNLRPGQDIAGGVSMIFEINEAGLERDENLAEDMKTLLAKRVDPKGVYDLTWRVHGRNRIEVQMPLPPAEAKRRQAEFQTAREALFAAVPKRSAIEAALAQTGEARDALIRKLTAGIESRIKLLEKAAQRYDAYQAALAKLREINPTGASSAPVPEEVDLAVRDAQELYEDAIDAAVATNLNAQRFQEVLEMDRGAATRTASFKEMKDAHPELAQKLDEALAAYDRWDEQKGYLDGPADLQRLLKGAGVLEFRILSEPSPENTTKFARYREQLQKLGPGPRPGDTEGWFRIDNPVAFFDLDSAAALKTFDVKGVPNMIVDRLGDNYFVLASLDPNNGLLQHAGQEWKLTRVLPGRNPQTGRLTVNFEFDAVGATRFGNLTGRNIGQLLCILVDDVAYSAPRINSKITRSGEIMGQFGVDKVQYLVQTMQAGALPARLKDTPLSERTIGSSLGKQNLERALRAGLWASIAVLAFMAVYYMWCGMIANVAMIMNLILTLAMMAFLQARFTLPGIAGMILTLGMVVDANVLVYERMREEKERGSSLRMIIKNGYEKASSTIIDANLTTILTAVILYYVGSEEVKGFGLTLGWGIVLSLFTSVFVTRVIFSVLVKYKLIKDIKMLKLIGVPTVDWYRLRKYFIPASIVTIGLGMALFFSRSRDELFDVEFNGGVAAEIELKQAVPGEDELRKSLDRVAQDLANQAPKVAQATVTPGPEGRMRVAMPGLGNRLIEAILTEPLEERGWLVRGGLDRTVGDGQVDVRVEGDVSADALQSFVRGLAGGVASSGKSLGRASFGLVLEQGAENIGRFWNITATEKNRRLVQYALEQAIGDRLVRQPQIAYQVRGPDRLPYPVTESRLEGVIPDLPPGVGADVSDYRGGAAIWYDALEPPQSLEAIRDRLRAMRLQPGYQDYPYRAFDLIGINATDQKDGQGRNLFRSFVLLVADPAYRYADDAQRWLDDFARKEMQLASATLDTEQSLRRVSQFKPQIAAQSTRKAVLALIFSWLMIIAYMWVRFGKLSYGLAGVVALVHDVLIALAAVGLSGWIGGANHPIGRMLLIEDFRIDMTIIAALLTIIGFSINDTIVTFDRIRELRGRLGMLTPQIINDAINQCLSRTIITSSTALLTVFVMYVLGGSSIRGFNFCMLVGCVTGVYSSIAIAAPILLLGKEVREVQPRPAARPVPA